MASREETLNDLVVWLLKDLTQVEAEWVNSGDFTDITTNDMHILDAIGLSEPKNMTSIARIMSVTTGTLTKAVDALVRKQYLKRERSEEDKRVVLISLTEKGVKAYHHHESFHREMMKQLTKGMREEEIQMLISALAKMRDHFKLHSKLDRLVDDFTTE